LAESPIAFEQLWARSKIVVLSTTSVRVVSIRDLIALKSVAGRPQDLQDIEALEEILKRQGADA
jgi:predicted nucleotidyltransferase